MDIQKICKIADSSNSLTLLSPDGRMRVRVNHSYFIPNPAEDTHFKTVFIWSGVHYSDSVNPDYCILDDDVSMFSWGEYLDGYAKATVQHYAEPDEIIAYFTGGSGSLLLYANENGTYSFDGEDYEYDADEVIDELFEAMTFEDAMGILDPLVYNLEYGDTNVTQGYAIRYFAYSANGGGDVEETTKIMLAYIAGDCYEFHEEYRIDPETNEWVYDEPWELVYGYDQLMHIIKTYYPDYKEI